MTTAQCLAANPGASITILQPERPPSSVDEINHRVANSLQMLSAFVAIEARRIADPVAIAALDMTLHRIAAIAGVQRLLYQSPEATAVDLGAYLEDLGRHLEESCGSRRVERRVRIGADAIDVSPEEATAVGVIVSELVGNACKYAYRADEPGNVQVTLRAVPSGGYSLDVIDHGRGMDLRARPEGSGLGSRIVSAMANQLHGHLDWQDARPGTRFTLRIGQN